MGNKMKFYLLLVYYSLRMGSYSEGYNVLASDENDAKRILFEKYGIEHKPNPVYGGVSVECIEITNENSPFLVYSGE